ncbi:MAG TPA: hypothetical protein PLT29_08740, partial [Bacteroidales bacterium]|nr:hypothetical protein [Bacteroidales bacterium]
RVAPQATPASPARVAPQATPASPARVAPQAAVPARDTTATPAKKETTAIGPAKKTPPAIAPGSPVQSGYRLQFLVTDKPLESGSNYFTRLKQRLPVLEITAVLEEDGRYHYVSQYFRTRSEALHWMRMVNGMGWKDCILR